MPTLPLAPALPRLTHSRRCIFWLSHLMIPASQNTEESLFEPSVVRGDGPRRNHSQHEIWWYVGQLKNSPMLEGTPIKIIEIMAHRCPVTPTMRLWLHALAMNSNINPIKRWNSYNRDSSVVFFSIHSIIYTILKHAYLPDLYKSLNASDCTTKNKT